MMCRSNFLSIFSLTLMLTLLPLKGFSKNAIRVHPQVVSFDELSSQTLLTMQIEPDTFSSLDTTVILDFPLASTFSLRTDTAILYPARSPFAPNAKLSCVLPTGKVKTLSPPDLRMYYGQFSSAPNTAITVIISEKTVFALIEDSEKRYWMLSSEGTHLPSIYQYAPVSFQLPNSFFCLDPEPQPSISEKLLDHSTLFAVNFDPLLVVKIALECDSELYRKMNRDTTRILRYVAALMAMVSRLYEKEINLTFEITWLRIWTEGEGEDPYTNNGNVPGLLQQLRNYWRQNNHNIPRALTHLLTTSTTGQVGGIAYRDCLCNNGCNYSVSSIHGTYTFPTPEYVWDVLVVAHEMGHNFGSRHTHDCWWNPPLDTCVTKDGSFPVPDACYASPIKPRPSEGSIMSYCHLINSNGVRLWFSPPVATVIRHGAEEQLGNDCVSFPDEPIVRLTEPIGNQTFPINKTLVIQWTAENIDSVLIEFGNQSRTQWKEIAVVAAMDKEYYWEIPDGIDTLLYIRISDYQNPLVADTSGIIRFKKPDLELLTVLDSAEFRAESSVHILWKAELVDSVAIEFSADNKRTWDKIATNIDARKEFYLWQIPSIESDECFIRILSKDDSTLVAMHQYPFRIGYPSLRIVSPRAQDIWYAGTDDTIKWESDFIKFLSLFISYDDGTNWERLKSVYPAQSAFFVLRVPDTTVNSARVKLKGDTLEVISDPFQIVSPATSREELSPSHLPLHVFSADNKVFLRMQSPGVYILHLYNHLGAKVFQTELYADPLQLHTFSLPSRLVPGIYYLIIQNNSTQIQKILIVGF